MQKNYRRTLLACYLGFITQAITANFVPLLCLSIHDNYSISFGRIALIPSAFFITLLMCYYLRYNIRCGNRADSNQAYFTYKIGKKSNKRGD